MELGRVLEKRRTKGSVASWVDAQSITEVSGMSTGSKQKFNVVRIILEARRVTGPDTEKADRLDGLRRRFQYWNFGCGGRI
jgi:hypothetical protein